MAEDPFADLADLLFNVGRLVRARTPETDQAVPLNETERLVMRMVDLHPGSSPTEIAERARLQRTNVSGALRSLESKGMVRRQATGGRGVAVHPTELAARNLRLLRSGWSRQLGGVLGDDLDAVRECAALLARLETDLTRNIRSEPSDG
ncbi:MarR family winged helix-turn-helix transcriptional regulator [Kineosporia mesophila]|nr:MarR family transcriptional regulator [Kineosporia mesophila]MCD5351372.1 MarR family transcriptional regulator [Kineosporia mesophila]